MNNIKLVIEYDGTNYVGWQQQKNGITIHGKLTKAIERVVCEEVCNSFGNLHEMLS